jgi:hypothetical protein
VGAAAELDISTHRRASTDNRAAGHRSRPT